MTGEDYLVGTLLAHVAERDDQSAERSARAMEGRNDLIPSLMPLLSDENGDRRWWGTRCLEAIGGAEAERLLAAALEDGADDIRCVAAIALGRLRSQQHLGALVERLADPSAWVRDSACDALATMGDAAVPALVQALADDRQGVRVRAAVALRRMRTQHPEAIRALFGALNDPNYLVQEQAYAALDRLGLLDNLIVQ